MEPSRHLAFLHTHPPSPRSSVHLTGMISWMYKLHITDESIHVLSTLEASQVVPSFRNDVDFLYSIWIHIAAVELCANETR